ncbi:MAG: glycosyltransferase family 39 protein [Chloroflexi bacterium]|nr:glycosyltransferase family 39 protein [Chloroflexota bacterium]
MARRWLWPLRGQPYFEGLALAAGLSLSLGVLSLLMLGLGLLPGAWLRPVTVLPIPWLGLAVSAWLERSQWVDALRAGLPAEWRQHRRTYALAWWLGLVGVGGLIVIAINAISYPFYRSDLLNRYGPQARELFSAGHVPQAMIGYPPGMPMLYAFAFFAAGAVNDHMAGMIIVAYAAAMLGAVWLVARLFAGQARLAVVFALSAPLFVDWATSGYVDVPEGVYRGLALAFAYFWLERGDKRFAILVGVMCGLALWMKQSSLALLPSLAVMPVLRLWKTDRSNRARELGQTGLMAAALLAVALPWYGRSFLLGGPGSLFVSANPLDVQGADHSPSLLLVFWERRNLWGWPLALTVLPGLLISVWLLIRRPQASRSPSLN